MADFHYKALKGLASLKRGQHVAWKHLSNTGQGFYHHAIVEAPADNGQFVNIITRSVDGINRAVMSSDEGLHEVTIESTPKVLDKDWQSKSKSVLTSMWNSITGKGSSQQLAAVEHTKQEHHQAEQSAATSTATSAIDKSETLSSDSTSDKALAETYARAVSLLGTKSYLDIIGKSCEDFAYYCVTGTPREQCCPLCKTTAPPKMSL